MNVICNTSTLGLDLDMHDVHFCLPPLPRHVTGDRTSTQGGDLVSKRKDDHSSDVMEMSLSFGTTQLEIFMRMASCT